jgi:diguanylate cyclase (GGDEF)-like protein
LTDVTSSSVGSWSTAQLVEFLALLGQETDERAVMRAAVERVLEALDAEVGVLAGQDGVATAVGLGPDEGPIADLVATASAGTGTIDLPRLGRCRTASATLDAGCRIVVARAGPDDFVPDELLLLRGMAWVLHLALRPLRTLSELKERQRALDHVSTIQHAIANRAPLPEVLDLVTESALGLFGIELAVLYLVDNDQLVIASVSTTMTQQSRMGVSPRLNASLGHTAYALGHLVRTDDYPAEPYAVPELVARGARAAMAAPVRENGTVVGSLAVVSFRRDRGFTDVHERTLLTFADQVSVALSDVKTLATAQHALRDAVTGLPNRVLFLQRLQQALARSSADSRTHLLFLDLDRFKLVNDTLGHAAGDELLAQVGRRLRECVRSQDTLARFGGDEYAVLVHDATDEAVLRLGERLLEALQSPYVIAGGAHEVLVGGSIGIASGFHGHDPGELLRDADTAMYRAKNAGGDRLVVFETSMHTSLVQRVSLEADLRRAIDGGELFVVYQPIVRLDTGEVHSAEALVRWQHPQRGTVSPAEFIPLAEETGLVIPLGRRVLAAACAEAASWPRREGSGLAAGPPPSVSVNLSGVHLHHPDLVADICHALDSTGLTPDRLILEITESTLMTDTASVAERLRRLRDIGVRLAIDDFGTGYSSLSHLRTFPVEILKIDRSFVQDGVVGWQGEAFLRTIVRLTETLSVAAVAEGVETDEQRRLLQQLGCPLGQGYLFSRPVPAAAFQRLLVDGGPLLTASAA